MCSAHHARDDGDAHGHDDARDRGNRMCSVHHARDDGDAHGRDGDARVHDGAHDRDSRMCSVHHAHGGGDARDDDVHDGDASPLPSVQLPYHPSAAQ